MKQAVESHDANQAIVIARYAKASVDTDRVQHDNTLGSRTVDPPKRLHIVTPVTEIGNSKVASAALRKWQSMGISGAYWTMSPDAETRPHARPIEVRLADAFLLRNWGRRGSLETDCAWRHRREVFRK